MLKERTAAGVSYTPNRTSPTSTTVYIFSGTKVLAEYENGATPGSPTREYIYTSASLSAGSGAQLLATHEGASLKYHHADHLSVRASTDTAGTPARTFAHYPYGEGWYETGTASKWKFTSYERDVESGNDYALARYYANRLGRFCSADLVPGSIGDPQSLNRFAYALNDPINLADPSGLCPLIVAGIKSNPSNPNDKGAQLLLNLARELGANVVFPFAGDGTFVGAARVFGQHLGLEGRAAAAARRGLVASAAEGPVSVIAFSGGAESFASVGSDRNLEYAFYLMPGSGIFTRLPTGSRPGVVLRGRGFVERFLGLLAQERRLEKVRINCRHGLNQCLLDALKEEMKKRGLPNLGRPCSDPMIFSPGGDSSLNDTRSDWWEIWNIIGWRRDDWGWEPIFGPPDRVPRCGYGWRCGPPSPLYS